MTHPAATASATTLRSRPAGARAYGAACSRMSSIAHFVREYRQRKPHALRDLYPYSDLPVLFERRFSALLQTATSAIASRHGHAALHDRDTTPTWFPVRDPVESCLAGTPARLADSRRSVVRPR